MYFYQQPLTVYILHDAACRLTNEHIIMTIQVQPIQWIVCIYNAGEVCLNGSADLDQADLKGSRSTHSDSKGDHELEFQSMPCYESRSGCAAFTFFFQGDHSPDSEIHRQFHGTWHTFCAHEIDMMAEQMLKQDNLFSTL